jgi:predicted outer membrane repeat protein
MQLRALFRTLTVVVFAFSSNAVTTGQTTVAVGSGADYDFGTIQEGIDAVEDGDVVLVAAGEYIVTAPITFRGKAITVRSEMGRDETVVRMGTPEDSRRACVVIFENNESPTAILEGFTITGGRGYWMTDPVWGTSELEGGGVACIEASPTIVSCTITKNTADSGGGVSPAYRSALTMIDCTISENSAPGSGGGICCWHNSSLVMTDCVVWGNSAPGTTLNVNGNGGGIFCGRNSELTLTNCRILDNAAGINGGGMMCWDHSALTMSHCEVIGNTSGRWSGGIGSERSVLVLINCLIAQNSAAMYCGGVQGTYTDSSLSIRNCTVVGNSAGQSGGGVNCWGGASLTVTNSIFWDNTAPTGPEIYLNTSPSTLDIAYSNLAGGRTGVHSGGGSTIDWGMGNIDTDPGFASLGYWAHADDPNVVAEPDDPNAAWVDGDYHLKSEVGRWDPRNETWVVDEVTSPCIDRGDPGSPIDSEPDPNGGLINMGAYGGTSEASMSIGYLPPLPLTPVAHWKLDETECETAFDNVGRNHAMAVGNPIWQPDGGALDGAIELDGIDDFLVADKVLNPAVGPFSILAWIKGGAPGQVIVAQTGGANWLRADLPEGVLATDLAPVGRVSVPPLVSDTVITDGVWHRVGFVWDGASRALYVDDLLVAEDVQNAPADCSGDLSIGCGKDMAPGTFLSGLIDDVCIYNSAVMP